MLRIGLFALALTGLVSTAVAQERAIEGVAPDVMAHVSSDMLSAQALSEGDEVLRVSFPYDQVGRLQNDLYRAAWRGQGELVMRAGTPLYRTHYRYLAFTTRGSEEVIHDLDWPVWCGPAAAEAGGAIGHCIVLRRGRAEVARIEGPTLHSNQLSEFTPVTMPQIADDPRAEAQLGDAELVYRLRDVSRDHVVVQLDLEENGHVETWERLRAPRDDDGAATLTIGGRALRIEGGHHAVRFTLVDDLQRVADAR